MLRIILWCIFSNLISLTINAQNIKYKLLSNEPPQSPRMSLNTDLVQLEMPQHSLDGMSMNLGLWGYYELKTESLGVEFLARKSWLIFGRLGNKEFKANTDLQIGAYWVLSNKLKNKQTKITLKKEYSGTAYGLNSLGDRTYSYTETETFILIPTDKKKITMLHGGFLRKQHGNNMDYLGESYSWSNNPENIIFQSLGLYTGINFRTLTSVFIESETYGVQFTSIGSDLYFDLLLLPINQFKNYEGDNLTEEIKSFTSSAPLGFRAGYKLFQIDKKAKTGKAFGLCGSMETGLKPYTGFYLSAGFGITLLK